MCLSNMRQGGTLDAMTSCVGTSDAPPSGADISNAPLSGVGTSNAWPSGADRRKYPKRTRKPKVDIVSLFLYKMLNNIQFPS
jgi:hypothetical protein